MYCKNCGNNVADGLAYCDVCGADMNADVTSYEENVVESVPAVDPGKGLGIASMVMGIVGFTCCNPFGLVGLIGLILGIVANKKSKAAGFKNTFATVGIIICAITIALGLIASIILVVVYGASFITALVGSTGSSYYYY